MPVKRNPYVASLIIHLAGLVIVFVLSYWSPRKVILTTDPIHIRFPSQKSEAKGDGAKASSPPEKKASPTPAPRKTSVPTPRATPAEKKPISTPKPVPTKVPEVKKTPPPPRPSPVATQKAPPAPTPRPQQTTAPRNPEARKTESPPPPAPPKPEPVREPPPAPPASVISPSGQTAPSSGALGLTGGLALPAYYAQQAIAAIASNFRVPESDQSDVFCLVAFHILSDGTIEAPRILQSSGSAKLDTMAIEALHKTRRLAPLPDSIGSNKVEAKLTFSFLSN